MTWGQCPTLCSTFMAEAAEEKQQIDPSGEEPVLALDLLEGNQASGIKTPQVTTIANTTNQILNMKEKWYKMLLSF